MRGVVRFRLGQWDVGATSRLMRLSSLRHLGAMTLRMMQRLRASGKFMFIGTSTNWQSAGKMIDSLGNEVVSSSA